MNSIESRSVTDRSRCWVCGGSEFTAVCIKEGASYVRCASCDVVRQNPYPTDEEIAKYYSDYQTRKSGNSTYLTASGFDALKRDKLLTFADLKLDPTSFAGKRLCDVGCATGQFLQFTSEYRPGYQLGVEVSEECVIAARASGLNVHQGDFLEIKEQFDYVSMWHVIEHLPRPRAFVEHAYRLLAPGGSLLIETPAVGVISESFREDWRFYMPVEHINLFSQIALFNLCRDAGFSINGWIRFGSGNDSGVVPAANKRAMDRVAKQLGCGDTIAAWFIK
jgi:2-polyprenyl-3-methyl-5-hydroxy-6-metoxy-1,4-benzoquinol methylase